MMSYKRESVENSRYKVIPVYSNLFNNRSLSLNEKTKIHEFRRRNYQSFDQTMESYKFEK